MENSQKETAFVNDEEVFNKTIKSVPKKEKEIGADLHNTLLDNIVEAGQSSTLDITSLESFLQISQSRDQVYAMLDTMSQDSIVSAILKTFAEYATESADTGRIVWAESTDEDVAKYVTFLLDSMNVDKNIYKWTHCLCKYGDVYFKLYRQSEVKDELFDNDDKKQLNEDVNIKAYSQNDHYTNYIEMVPNPATMYELTKFGKTYGYVKAPVVTPTLQTNSVAPLTNYRYQFNKRDIDVYPATEFVHAALEDDFSRTPEIVDIVLDNVENTEDSKIATYTVRRGQSILYTKFKIWREMNLIENSILLNRITKSSIVRVIGVEVGDMPKESVGPHLNGIKQLVEQKSAINEGVSLNEYTNPGPIENNIYVPTRNGIGGLTTSQIGGDVDIKSIADLDYLVSKFFGSFSIPKQFFGQTEDGAGFNGGQSLAIISSQFAKGVKRIQSTMTQAMTDAINLMLIDRGLGNYVNKFEIKMLPPTTQEELDRRDNLSTKVQLTSDIMNLLGDVDDNKAKLRILKSMLANITDNPEVIEILQEYIDTLDEEGEDQPAEEDGEQDISVENDINLPNAPVRGTTDFMSNIEGSLEEPAESTEIDNSETMLPSPDELGVDLTDNTTEI